MKRTIKYLINLICLSFLVFGIAVSFAIIVRVSSLKRLFEIIWLQAERISIVSITFLIIVTYLNFAFERKIEKKSTCEFIIFSLIHSVVIILAFTYFSYDFYCDYIEHPEYF